MLLWEAILSALYKFLLLGSSTNVIFPVYYKDIGHFKDIGLAPIQMQPAPRVQVTSATEEIPMV